MKFSFVLIARNEEKTLPRLLESLSAFKAAGGEVCVLDTGSTDRTLEIAKAWGCVTEAVGDKYRHTVELAETEAINEKFVIPGEEPLIHEGEAYFDFGSARNHAASLASNNMVSFVDADEILVTLDFEATNKYIEEGFDQFEYSFVYAHDNSGNSAIEFIQSKFYDRTKMEWKGIIHEVLTGNGNRKFLSKKEFGLEHFQNVETNRTGYLRGLAVDCFNNPTNDRNSHYLAREMMYCGRLRSAIKEFERHVGMNGWTAEKAQSLIYIGDCEGKLNHPQRQIHSYFEAFYICAEKREPLIKIAQFFKANNNPRATLAFASAAMEVPWTGFYADSKADYEYVPHELKYWALGWTGDIKGAQHHLLEALRYQPLNPRYLADTRYYFEYKYPDIEGWMTFTELNWLYNTAKGMGSVAEIGSWKGRSTHALLSSGTQVTAIDTWEGSADPRDGTHGVNTFNEFQKNVGHFQNLRVVHSSSLEAAENMEGSFDMIFIDAGHTYEEVKADILAWKPYAKKIICGHDYSDTWPEVKRAVDETVGGLTGVVDTIWFKIL